MASGSSNNSPAPAQASSSVLLCSPDGDATPDRVCRVARSIRTVSAVVDDCRSEWTAFLEADYGEFGDDEKEVIKGLFKLFPKG